MVRRGAFLRIIFGLGELKPGDTMDNGIDQTDWSPTRKVVGGAIAVLALFGVQAAVPDLEIPIGVEGALTIVVAYLVPDKTRTETVVERVSETRVVDVEVDNN